MAIFNSTNWTGKTTEATVGTMDRPAPAMAPAPARKIQPRVDTNTMTEDAIADYRATAKAIGISDQDILVEEFRLFLAKHDIPVFNHQEVVAYMDEIAAKDNPTGLGWHWCPVRDKDAEVPMWFGRPSTEDRYSSRGERKDIPSSDYYESHKFNEWSNRRGGWIFTHAASDNKLTNVQSMQAMHDSARAEILANNAAPTDWRTLRSPAYTRTLPLHALKKIALIENGFTAGKVVFLVTDYTVAPHIIINPDPFLMAVIPNSAVSHGKGRFIIDVWDEPGFGITRMVR